MPATRRLTAILAADVVGYSRLMRADEEGTHERFKVHRSELIFPKAREHHGRIVKYTGDGMLAEFPSIVEAVLCAVEVQCGMSRVIKASPTMSASAFASASTSETSSPSPKTFTAMGSMWPPGSR